MSAIHTWACFLLWISFTTQNKTPDVTVRCFVSEDCMLPCSFQPGSNETIEWFRQGAVVYKFNQSKVGHFKHEQLAGRASIFPSLVSRGNATLVLRSSGLKDRGMYRCHVHTTEGEHDAKVILKIEAPIRGLVLELSRLSGYEEMKCTVQDVYPAPRVTWETEPQTFEDLRPITRILANKKGLYNVDSRLKRLTGPPNLVYICKVTISYGGPTWTGSLREREIKEFQGKDLTIPCSAPSYMNNPSLHWTFSNSEHPSPIFNYDSRSGKTRSSPDWKSHVELDHFRVQFGDGSLRLMDPKHSEHTGRYTCVFSMPHGTHTERSDVTIVSPDAHEATAEPPSHWWILGLVAGLLILVLVGVLAYRKLKGGNVKSRKDPEAVTELHSVKGAAAGETNLSESSPLTTGSTNGQSDPQAGSKLT
ncbi:V-set domain-containing T-cell activation inhibitor 1-like [Archocentrus centrarchus]|uniref:V-set domain-containing T-cell activation inhibitor 1-like n=1 Tax=Archocentrus centrarchus TaxID=63155 RepID=UPI0011E9BC14|nr:V-set domain-containing T-cell activation inhibitor 1-like [Archocentrus centrarchus]